jgi:uncharacterized protein
VHRWIRWHQRLAQCLAGLALALGAQFVPAQDLQAIPALSGHVIDAIATLSESQRRELDNKLIAFEASTGAQVVVLVVLTTAPEDIASYANRVGNSWKIGRKDIGDGLILLVAKNDRKLRIEVAKTLEGAIPDLMAKRVIDQTITPHFKQGNFAAGIDAGLDDIMALIRGEALPAPASLGTGQSNEFEWMDLAVFLFFAVAIGGKVVRQLLGNKLGSLVMGAAAGGSVWFVTSSILLSLVAAVVGLVFTLFASLSTLGAKRGGTSWGSAGSGGGWSSGSGGGGFSSGGGGDFGGGGASGGW